MVNEESLAPAVSSILSAARERGGGDERLAVDARSVAAAFRQAEQKGRVPIIAEIKPTSPTTDGVRESDPVEVATEMVGAGASALSVLTEPDHFGGSPENLERVRDAVDVPVLRKDFVVQESQLDTVPADVILLIARFVDDLEAMVTAARERGFQVLVETHTQAEVERALAAGAEIIGVNNRDLAQLEVDLGTFEEVTPAVPAETTVIAESGIESTAHVRRMREAGADGLLVGSAIMAGDVHTNTKRLVSAETEPETPAQGHEDETTGDNA